MLLIEGQLYLYV